MASDETRLGNLESLELDSKVRTFEWEFRFEF